MPEDSQSHTVTVISGDATRRPYIVESNVYPLENNVYPVTIPDEPTINWIDNFDDGDLSEYFGSTEMFTTQQSVVHGGTHALEAIGDNFSSILSSPGDGLENYPTQGDRWRYYTRVSSTNGIANSYMIFGAQGTVNDTYEVQVNFSTGELYINKWSGGSEIAVGDETISSGVTANEWYQVTVTWDDGTLGGSTGDITATIESLDGSESTTATGNDTEWTGGDVGWAADQDTDGKSVYYDQAGIITAT